LRVAALVTGGKDSALALYRVMKKGYDAKCLVTMLPKREDSWMFHYPNIQMADLFAHAVGIPLVKAETSGVKDVELEDLKRVLAKLDVDAVVSGGISSQYQKKSIDKICQELGFVHVAPLWQEDPLRLLEEIILLGMETIIVGVYAYGFDQTWLGRKIDESALKDLRELNRKYVVSLVGEGGEYETLVLDAPFFKQRIELVETEVFWKGESGYLLVKKAALVDKEKKE
jgi:ABC transporter with metal-binding/Fe-S-binding domain ATP-binding protein